VSVLNLVFIAKSVFAVILGGLARAGAFIWLSLIKAQIFNFYFRLIYDKMSSFGFVVCVLVHLVSFCNLVAKSSFDLIWLIYDQLSSFGFVLGGLVHLVSFLIW
jgi:hypothetical protein